MDGLVNHRSVRVKNPELTNEKIRRMRVGGVDQLQVLADFDYTLTRYMLNGEKCWTAYRIFNDEFAPGVGTKLHQLHEHYFPIEFSAELTTEEKLPHMLTWWKAGNDAIVSGGFTHAQLVRMVKEAKMYFREGAVDFLNKMELLDVPLLIFSAGNANVIEIKLEEELSRIPKNVLVVSNRMLFDEETQKVVAFSEPLVHTFNKNQSVLSSLQKDLITRLFDRPNVLLLGDSFGDSGMDQGMNHSGVCLKIGFLNQNFDQLLPQYLDLYDIVIVDDQSMEVPFGILDLIMGKSHVTPEKRDLNGFATGLQISEAVVS